MEKCESTELHGWQDLDGFGFVGISTDFVGAGQTSDVCNQYTRFIPLIVQPWQFEHVSSILVIPSCHIL